MQPYSSGDLDGSGIAREVFKGISEEDFSSSAVETLLDMVHSGNEVDLLSEVLTYLTQQGRPDWAAEICRMVMGYPEGMAPTKDYKTIALALAQAANSGHAYYANKVCSYIMAVKTTPQGTPFFECDDLASVFAKMVEEGQAQAGGLILYECFCDGTSEGQLYHSMIPGVMISLLDSNQDRCAVQLCHYLMYADDRNIDYSVVGWLMVNLVMSQKAKWAARLCREFQAQKESQMRWYNQHHLFQAVSSWGQPQYVQQIKDALAQLDRQDRAKQQGQAEPSTPVANGHGLDNAMTKLSVIDNGTTANTSTGATSATPTDTATATGTPQTPATAANTEGGSSIGSSAGATVAASSARGSPLDASAAEWVPGGKWGSTPAATPAAEAASPAT